MDFLYKKHPKGTYEYASYRKKIDIIVMIVMFMLALGLYVIGRVTTGSNKNLLTIVAVLGLLPACKMVVDVIMCLRVHPCDEDLKSRIDEVKGLLCGMYNMYFTSYDKNFYVDHMVITRDSLIGLSTDKKFDEKAFSAHMTDLMGKDGIKNILIKIFDDEDKYINRLNELNVKASEDDVNTDVLRLVLNVSL
jgi:hypothetical protein